GGLLFATQTIGQVRSGLHERDAERWQDIVRTLDRAEDAAVHRVRDLAHSARRGARQAGLACGDRLQRRLETLGALVPAERPDRGQCDAGLSVASDRVTNPLRVSDPGQLVEDALIDAVLLKRLFQAARVHHL